MHSSLFLAKQYACLNISSRLFPTFLYLSIPIVPTTPYLSPILTLYHFPTCLSYPNLSPLPRLPGLYIISALSSTPPVYVLFCAHPRVERPLIDLLCYISLYFATCRLTSPLLTTATTSRLSNTIIANSFRYRCRISFKVQVYNRVDTNRLPKQSTNSFLPSKHPTSDARRRGKPAGSS